MTSILEMKPGDYVKVESGYKEIASTYGITYGIHGKRLAKPSEGFFGVTTTDGATYSGWQIKSYHKRDELKAP